LFTGRRAYVNGGTRYSFDRRARQESECGEDREKDKTEEKAQEYKARQERAT
jgi:hypothetical protein